MDNEQRLNRVFQHGSPGPLTKFADNRAYDEPSDEERDRPEYWRFWRALPPKGYIGLFLSSWYSQPILRRVYAKDGGATFDDRPDRMLAFEKSFAEIVVIPLSSGCTITV